MKGRGLSIFHLILAIYIYYIYIWDLVILNFFKHRIVRRWGLSQLKIFSKSFIMLCNRIQNTQIYIRTLHFEGFRYLSTPFQHILCHIYGLNGDVINIDHIFTVHPYKGQNRLHTLLLIVYVRCHYCYVTHLH